MSKEVFLKSNDFRLLYFRYKDTPYYTILIISLIFLVCMILISQLIVPQVQNWFSIRDEVIATQARIDVINQNINFMNSIDKVRIEKQVSLTASALPFEKDFGGILNAITDASGKAGVSLDDYSFQVGSIASVSGKQSRAVKDLSSVRVTIEITGDMEGVASFLKEINTKLPLVDVVEVDGEFNKTKITMDFFQKQFPKIVFKDDQPLVPISKKHQELLVNWESWVPVAEAQVPSEISSESALPLF
jgi:hypothetical protein